MSDKDKGMSESFEFAKDKKDKKEKKSARKLPKRSLFLGGEKKDKEPKPKVLSESQVELKPQTRFLEGILKEKPESLDKAKPDSEAKRDAGDDESSQAEGDGERSAEAQDSQPEGKAEKPTTVSESYEGEMELEEEFQEIVIDKLSGVENEMEDSEAADHVEELSADAGFLSKVGKKMAEGSKAEQAIDAALDESLHEPLEVESDSDSDGEGSERPIENTAATEALDSEDGEAEPEVGDMAQVPATATPPVRPSTRPTRPALATAASRTHPQAPPFRPPPPPNTPNTPPPNFPGPPRQPNFGGPNFNVSPPSPNINTANFLNNDPNMSKMNSMYYRNKNTGRVILAGLLGYAIGRRGGRKRTEARLQPEIDKGKKDVKGLEQKLDYSEQAVRKKAFEAKSLKEKLSERERYEQPAVSPNVLAAARESVAKSPTEKTKAELPVEPQILPAETAAAEIQELRAQQEQFAEGLIREDSLSLEPKVKNRNLSENIVLQAGSSAERATVGSAAERLAAISPVIAEARVSGAQQEQEKTAKRKKLAEQMSRSLESEKSVDTRTMTMPEVLEIAETIDTGAGSLKELFELKKIDAVNLRKIVAEHAAGRNYDSFMHKSLEAEEMHRELRNEVKTADGDSGHDGGGFSKSVASADSGGSAVGGGGAAADGRPSTSYMPTELPNMAQVGMGITTDFSASNTGKSQKDKIAKDTTVATIVLGLLVGILLAVLVLVIS